MRRGQRVAGDIAADGGQQRLARRAIAGEIQEIIYSQGVAVPWGQFAQPAAYRNTLRNLIPSAIPLFWNVEKR